MSLIDLTHPISSSMQVYPGTDAPVVERQGGSEEEGFALSVFTLQSHMGTHMDAPAHYFRSGKTLDQLDIETFMGKAVIVDARQIDGNIDIADLEIYRQEIEGADFVVLFTGWSQNFGREAYFYNFPILTREAAKWLTTFNLKGVAMDTISVDAVESTEYDNHKILLKRGFVIVENLTNLEQINQRTCQLSMFPLKLEKADGAPIRAIAILT